MNLSRMLDEMKSGNELQVSLDVVESRYAIHLILLLVLQLFDSYVQKMKERL